VEGWINGMHLDVRAFGPPLLKQMTEDFMRAYKTTVDFWAEDFEMVAVDVKEVSARNCRRHGKFPICLHGGRAGPMKVSRDACAS
jgi:hypothetical protein